MLTPCYLDMNWLPWHLGLPVAAVLEVVGWASMGAGLVLGIGGEYLSQKAL